MQYSRHIIKGPDSLLSLAVNSDTLTALSEDELKEIKSNITQGKIKKAAFRVSGSVVLEDLANLVLDTCTFFVPDGLSMQPVKLQNCYGTTLSHCNYAIMPQ